MTKIYDAIQYQNGTLSHTPDGVVYVITKPDSKPVELAGSIAKKCAITKPVGIKSNAYGGVLIGDGHRMMAIYRAPNVGEEAVYTLSYDKADKKSFAVHLNNPYSTTEIALAGAFPFLRLETSHDRWKKMAPEIVDNVAGLGFADQSNLADILAQSFDNVKRHRNNRHALGIECNYGELTPGDVDSLARASLGALVPPAVGTTQVVSSSRMREGRGREREQR